MAEQQELERWLWSMLHKFVREHLGDPGEVVKARVTNAEGAAAEVDADRRWVVVWLQSVVDENRRFLGRLFSPGGLLWWLPDDGEVGAMLRAGHLGGALTTLFLGGHGGAANRVPSWLAADRFGLFARAGKYLRLDAEDKDVEITAAGGKVKAQGGGRAAAGKDHPIGAGTIGITSAGPVAGVYTISLTWTPEGGGLPIVIGSWPTAGGGAPGSHALVGKITDGSSKVEIDS